VVDESELKMFEWKKEQTPLVPNDALWSISNHNRITKSLEKYYLLSDCFPSRVLI